MNHYYYVVRIRIRYLLLRLLVPIIIRYYYRLLLSIIDYNNYFVFIYYYNRLFGSKNNETNRATLNASLTLNAERKEFIASLPLERIRS